MNCTAFLNLLIIGILVDTNIFCLTYKTVAKGKQKKIITEQKARQIVPRPKEKSKSPKGWPI